MIVGEWLGPWGGSVSVCAKLWKEKSNWDATALKVV